MSSRKCGIQYYGSMDLWYVWSYPMPGSMVCVVLSYVWIFGMCGLSFVVQYYGSVVCPVLSYVVPYYDGMVCVAVCPVLPSYGVRGPILCRPRPASAFYVFRPITEISGLSASVSSTQHLTRPPLGGVAPRGPDRGHPHSRV